MKRKLMVVEGYGPVEVAGHISDLPPGSKLVHFQALLRQGTKGFPDRWHGFITFDDPNEPGEGEPAT